ncbi:MAG: Asp-tRNA(Asn)/Glu-tRNA(Gln) amidotransferase subunit GatC [Elusimicrobia bacterium]|nr:Asp-tRNA(Asn)/Glu-tRNA(Gln) amidotransferase subunit GatC [Elusimicrobiota bacterium]
MKISPEVVSKIAGLARLRLTEEEAPLYQSQLGAVLDHMADLAGLGAAAVEPGAGAPGLSSVLREDEPEAFQGREELLANAPEREGPYFKVRKVL